MAAKRWAEAHPQRVKVLHTLARAREKVKAGNVTAAQWDAIRQFYGHACALCRGSAEVQPLTIDHYVPLAKGGTHAWTNVWPLCLPCNRKKATRLLAGPPPHVAVVLLAIARVRQAA